MQDFKITLMKKLYLMGICRITINKKISITSATDPVDGIGADLDLLRT